MLDYEINKCSRRCAATGRDLKPGDTYYTVLRWQDRQIVREDYAAEAWQAPPDGILGWWRARIPHGHPQRQLAAPQEVMLHILETRLADPSAQDFCFVLALLLIRRRMVRLEAEETDAHQQRRLVLFSPKTEAEYRVPVVQPHPERIHEIEAELSAILFGDSDQDIAAHGEV